MNPDENNVLATFLCKPPKGPTDEASYRAACGRAYYWAFATVRDILLRASINVPKDGTGHQVVISSLKDSTDDDIKAAASLLDNLRTTRNSADYEVGLVPLKGTPFVKTRAQVAVVQATSIVDAVVN